MAESFLEAAQNVTKGALHVGLAYRDFSFFIGTDDVHVAEVLCCTAVTLGALYTGYKLIKLFTEAVTNGFGGERNDQEVREIRPGSLHVLLRCYTDERFLEVLEDYESGRITERLQKEFSQIGIEVEGLKVEIENMEEVNKTKEAINNKRSSYSTEVMAEGEAKTTKKIDLLDTDVDEWKLSTSQNQGFQIYISEEHGNWLTVGDIIRSIQKPIFIFVDGIVKAFHEKLCKDLLPVGKCRSPEDCNKKTKPSDLCKSCECWFKELETSHRTGNNPLWHKNCNSARWSDDHWEVAKFFMPALGSNLSTVKDAESTDLSSLLNVLEWMKDQAFLGKTRVNVDLVRKLRSQMRNTWAHAPKQELSDDERVEGFSIATDFLEDLEKVCPNTENGKCLEHLKTLKCNGVTNVVESKLQSLLLQRYLLDDKEDITKIKVERLPDKSTIKEHERQKEEREATSCLPDRLPMFTGRETEIRNVITLLKDERKAVVSLHGGPGFGKTAIAIEVSHKLSEDHNIPVVFTQLTTATTVDEMVLRLCSDVGLYHEDNPKSSLILWLKNIKSKLIFVMDDIDNLLEEKTSFYEFVCLLRKNSNRHCQIVMTSRTSCEIPDLLTGKVEIDEMDDEECMELLRKQCPEQEDEYLRSLAELCGNIPLAMCIAGSRVDDFENPANLLMHLQIQPMETLECPESDQYVHQAINMSYEKCTREEEETLLRLVVFEGSFSEDAAKAVVENVELVTKRILKKLVSGSLIKQPTKHRYSIHLLIKHFLKDQQKIENEIAERAREQAMRAELLMVRYYVKLGHDLTIKSYSKDGYKENREALKQEAHNIQIVLKICCQQKDASSDIPDCLAHRKIYTTSARFFTLFVRTIISGSIVDEFLQRCANLAEEKQQHAIKLNFDCLLADQERSKSIGKSDEYFNSKMEKIEEEFKTHHDDLKKDKSLCAHYYYQYGRYLSRKSESHKDEERLALQIQARKQLEKSLKLREMLTDKSEGIADKVFSLLHLGNVCKIISATELFLHKSHESKKLSEQAQEYYGEAIQLSRDHLGEHELTSACYKSLGDLFLKINNHNMAKENYIVAKKMRENLGLDASERHVFLLNNLGICLTKSKQTNESIEVLESARDMAEKLAESEEPNLCKSKVYTALAFAHNSPQRYSEDAVKYAKKALEFDEIENVIKTYEYKKLQEILTNNAGNN